MSETGADRTDGNRGDADGIDREPDDSGNRRARRKRRVLTWVVLELVTVALFVAWWVERPRSAQGPPPVTANPAIRAGTDVPNGTASQADTLLMDVTRVDSTILVDMRYFGTRNFMGEQLPGYEANRALMRREAALALGRVQSVLRADGLGLKVWDAYRPYRATLAMVAWTQRVKREDLVRDGYISDRSKHNLGVAIDLTLVQLSDAHELDMGTPHDSFLAAAHTANATGPVAANRAKLVHAMESAGFVNYDQEWWHFSFDVQNPLRFDVVVR